MNRLVRPEKIHIFFSGMKTAKDIKGLCIYTPIAGWVLWVVFQAPSSCIAQPKTSWQFVVPANTGTYTD